MSSMQSLVLSCCMLVCCLVLVAAAPVKKSDVNVESDVRVSRVISALTHDTGLAPSRSRRSAGHHAKNPNLDMSMLEALSDELDNDPIQRRHRRSALFFLTSAMKLCNSYPVYCQNVQIEEGTFRATLQLAEE